MQKWYLSTAVSSSHIIFNMRGLPGEAGRGCAAMATWLTSMVSAVCASLQSPELELGCVEGARRFETSDCPSPFCGRQACPTPASSWSSHEPGVPKRGVPQRTPPKPHGTTPTSCSTHGHPLVRALARSPARHGEPPRPDLRQSAQSGGLAHILGLALRQTSTQDARVRRPRPPLQRQPQHRHAPRQTSR